MASRRRRKGSALRRRYGRATSRSKFVVRRGGFDEVYLQPGGSWGPYNKARRFGSQDSAESAFRRSFTGENFGIFPVSRGARR